MPQYAFVGSIYVLFPAINTAQLTGLTSAVAVGFIEHVEALINARLAKKYSLPFTNGCPMLSALATREAIYHIAVTRGLVHFPPATQGRAPLAMQHAEDQKLLQSISDGEIQLLDSSMALIAGDTTQAEFYSTTQNYNPTFHEGAWVDQVQDTDKLSDLAADRDGRGL